MSVDSPLRMSPLAAVHRAQGARMIPFAGYEMPLHYEDGILAEHIQTRQHVGLFDVSHLGQAKLTGLDHPTTAGGLEALVPADILHLRPGHMRYTQLLTPEGGIIADVMVSRPSEEGRLNLIFNAGREQDDFAHLERHLPSTIHLKRRYDLALLALQGPQAARVLAEFDATLPAMPFLTVRPALFGRIPVIVSRSGYTGEDGFEISLEARDAGQVWAMLTSDDSVKPVGLGARESLRLEAGLCLYGHDIDVSTSPVEAGLAFSIQKRRREEGGFPGAARIQAELAEGPSRCRVGLLLDGRQPAREGHAIIDPTTQKKIGTVTSGGFGPTVNAPIAMGYVPRSLSKPGTRLQIMVRNKAIGAEIVPLPFVAHRFFRGD